MTFNFKVFRNACESYKSPVIGVCLYIKSNVETFKYTDIDNIIDKNSEYHKYIGFVNVWDSTQDKPKRFKVKNGRLYPELRQWINKEISLEEATTEEKSNKSNWSKPSFSKQLAFITFKRDDGMHGQIEFDDLDHLNLNTIHISNINATKWIPLYKNNVLTFTLV